MLVNLKDGEIICLAFANGRKHDFRLFQEAHIHVPAETLLEADTRYQGLVKPHANSSLPQKRSKRHPLTKQARSVNCEISRTRMFVEHAIRFVKRFTNQITQTTQGPRETPWGLELSQKGNLMWYKKS